MYEVRETAGKPEFYIPDYVKQDKCWIQCPEEFELNMRTGQKVKRCGCGHKFKWSQRKKIPWSSEKFIAYNNEDVRKKVLSLPKYSVLICLTGNTRIPIEDKDGKSIKKLYELENRNDFKVLSYDITKDKFEYKKPEKCIKTAKWADVFEIELENGTKIQATENHQFLTQRGYVALKDLTNEDEIMQYSQKCNHCQKD